MVIYMSPKLVLPIMEKYLRQVVLQEAYLGKMTQILLLVLMVRQELLQRKILLL
jgi:hypothetical protein